MMDRPFFSVKVRMCRERRSVYLIQGLQPECYAPSPPTPVPVLRPKPAR
jgi:hypothetical protein